MKKGKDKEAKRSSLVIASSVPYFTKRGVVANVLREPEVKRSRYIPVIDEKNHLHRRDHYRVIDSSTLSAIRSIKHQLQSNLSSLKERHEHDLELMKQEVTSARENHLAKLGRAIEDQMKLKQLIHQQYSHVCDKTCRKGSCDRLRLSITVANSPRCSQHRPLALEEKFYRILKDLRSQYPCQSHERQQKQPSPTSAFHKNCMLSRRIEVDLKSNFGRDVLNSCSEEQKDFYNSVVKEYLQKVSLFEEADATSKRKVNYDKQSYRQRLSRKTVGQHHGVSSHNIPQALEEKSKHNSRLENGSKVEGAFDRRRMTKESKMSRVYRGSVEQSKQSFRDSRFRFFERKDGKVINEEGNSVDSNTLIKKRRRRLNKLFESCDEEKVDFQEVVQNASFQQEGDEDCTVGNDHALQKERAAKGKLDACSSAGSSKRHNTLTKKEGLTILEQDIESNACRSDGASSASLSNYRPSRRKSSNNQPANEENSDNYLDVLTASDAIDPNQSITLIKAKLRKLFERSNLPREIKRVKRLYQQQQDAIKFKHQINEKAFDISLNEVYSWRWISELSFQHQVCGIAVSKQVPADSLVVCLSPADKSTPTVSYSCQESAIDERQLLRKAGFKQESKLFFNTNEKNKQNQQLVQFGLA